MLADCFESGPRARADAKDSLRVMSTATTSLPVNDESAVLLGDLTKFVMVHISWQIRPSRVAAPLLTLSPSAWSLARNVETPLGDDRV